MGMGFREVVGVSSGGRVVDRATSSQDERRIKSPVGLMTVTTERSRWPKNHGKRRRNERVVARPLERMPWCTYQRENNIDKIIYLWRGTPLKYSQTDDPARSEFVLDRIFEFVL